MGTTPFWQYSQRSLFQKEKLTKADTQQCVLDWSRDVDDITFNGKQFSEVLKERGFSAETLTQEQLKEVWRSFLPQEMSATKQDEFISFFAQSFHQGGVPYALRGRLTDIAKDAGHMVASTQGKMNFTVLDGKLIIKEEVHLDKINLNSNSKYQVQKLSAEEGSHLLSGTAVYSIDFAAEEPSVECVDLVLNHHNETTEKIFDTRIIIAKIVDFLISLCGMNKLNDGIEDNPSKTTGTTIL